MKVNDLVKAKHSEAIGIIVDVIQKKVWRSDLLGHKIDWNLVEPEPHGVVLYAYNNGTVNIPMIDLEVVNENR